MIPMTIAHLDYKMAREVHLRTALFWVITQRVVVISYRHFRTNYRSHPQDSRIQKSEIIKGTPSLHKLNFINNYIESNIGQNKIFLKTFNGKFLNECCLNEHVDINSLNSCRIYLEI